MPQLMKLRFVSVGHSQARLEDVVLDFCGPDGRAADSTIWLRNGGGKSSILNLFFAIVRPNKREFLGGKADAKQRTLDDYILPGDRSVTVAEWQLDPAVDSLGLEVERFLTGVFYERRDGAAEPRHLFFSCRVSADHPESTLEGLPLYTVSQGGQTRRTLIAFREAWRSLRDRAPHLHVGDTEHQREWQEVLEAARIDPELFSYQVRMNQHEGGADEIFRFAEAEEFVDFLLALALDPALGDRVGRNLTAFRRELLQRKEQLLPERHLVAGLLERMSTVRQIRLKREQLKHRLGEARDELVALEELATGRVRELGEDAKRGEDEEAAYAAAAVKHHRQAEEQRARAALLRRHAAELRLKRFQDEYNQVHEEWRSIQRLAKILGAAVPLRGALRFEEMAREQRRLLGERQREHAPLRARLVESARRLASALTFRAQDLRGKAESARTEEKRAREEAGEHRERAAVCGQTRAQAETRAGMLEERIADVESKRDELVREGCLAADEPPESGLSRWILKAQEHEDAGKRIEGEIERLDVALGALADAVRRAGEVLGDWQTRRKSQADRLQEATREREAIEGDAVLRSALELEHIDADRLGTDAINTLEQAARGEQHVAVESRLAMADDERAALHLAEHGLLPPSTDAQRVMEFLGSRLGGQAWSGWSWIAANVPKEGTRDAIRRAPSLAQGVVVRPADLERAAELLQESGIEPEGPLLLASTDAWAHGPGPAGLVLGPRESAWFDRDVARARLGELQTRLERNRERLNAAEARHRDLSRAREALRSFRARYPAGWFERFRHELQKAEQREKEARSHRESLEEEQKQKAATRKQLEAQLRSEEKALLFAQGARQRLGTFVEGHARPLAGWRADLEAAKQEARHAAHEAEQERSLAGAADERAHAASSEAQRHGEEARVIESERLGLRYADGEVVAEPGPLDELRDGYNLICGQYEKRVGADALAALAQQNDENARAERARLAKLLSAEVTEEIVQEHVARLAEPDTIDQQRDAAETKASSLQGKMGNIKGQMVSAGEALERAEAHCKALALFAPLDKAPSNPESAETEASTLDGEAMLAQSHGEAAQARADEMRERADTARQKRVELEGHIERIQTLRDDYADLFAAATMAATPRASNRLEESSLADRIKKLSGGLRGARSEWALMDTERGVALSALRTFTSAPEFERLDAPWLRRLQEHDEPGFEDSSDLLSEQLELRRNVLEEQISGVDRHRTILVDELQAVAEEGLKLLRQASGLSKLPDHVPGLGGAHFLRVETREPDDPGERRARLAELIDELLGGQHDIGGIGLVQSAVRRLARPVQVRVLHPDPALERRTVSIPEMARSSGGEQLTGAILLYCTLARVRGRARGLSKRASSVLILDNPIGRASRVRFLELQRDVARAMGVQLIYTTGVNDHEALRALPNIMRLRNERVDRNTGRRLVEHAPNDMRVLEAVHMGRRGSDASLGAAAETEP